MIENWVASSESLRITYLRCVSSIMIILYLNLHPIEGYMSQIKENIEMGKDRQKTYADKSLRPSPNYKAKDLVWVKLHPLSKASQNRSAKLMPRRDGPYIVV
ncbi:retrovirus-related Pol polyprotein from transposon 412 [Trichonephila clavipes]|nr:retrovirus-related Pol polyprotein from transposon 412 [Trichonephila clavipes]